MRINFLIIMLKIKIFMCFMTKDFIFYDELIKFIDISGIILIEDRMYYCNNCII